jgi:hydrogenase expression/formation protein HypC
MCLAIPAQVTELSEREPNLALVDILGVRRRISIDLLADSPPRIGDWVLIHVGFALSKISPEQADEQLKMLALLGEDSAAREEAAGYETSAEGPSAAESTVSDAALSDSTGAGT